MGLAAAGTVAVAVLVAMTLLPALLGFAGARVLGRAARQRRAPADPSRERRPSGSAGRAFIARRPRARPDRSRSAVARRHRAPGARPAAGPAGRQHRRPSHHPAQGLRPDRARLRPRLQRTADAWSSTPTGSADPAAAAAGRGERHHGAFRTSLVVAPAAFNADRRHRAPHRHPGQRPEQRPTTVHLVPAIRDRRAGHPRHDRHPASASPV